MTELRRAIHEERDKAREPTKVFPAAFVTFRRRTSQVGGLGRAWVGGRAGRGWGGGGWGGGRGGAWVGG